MVEGFVGNGGKTLECIPGIEIPRISTNGLFEGAELGKAGMVILEVARAKSIGG